MDLKYKQKYQKLLKEWKLKCKPMAFIAYLHATFISSIDCIEIVKGTIPFVSFICLSFIFVIC
ncbi:hypothetical protein KSS87_010654 [Heliosperma pusillum]|nr:hypothetical protein KSS87_010654 [Heliosperma pusillum]